MTSVSPISAIGTFLSNPYASWCHHPRYNRLYKAHGRVYKAYGRLYKAYGSHDEAVLSRRYLQDLPDDSLKFFDVRVIPSCAKGLVLCGLMRIHAVGCAHKLL